MPISGVVITGQPGKMENVLGFLETFSDVEVHGDDEKGNIVAVLDSDSSESMQNLIDLINKNEDVLHVGLTYLNTEDEAEQISDGRQLARPFGFNKASSTEQ